jgi:hypothetical protein
MGIPLGREAMNIRASPIAASVGEMLFSPAHPSSISLSDSIFSII